MSAHTHTSKHTHTHSLTHSHTHSAVVEPRDGSVIDASQDTIEVREEKKEKGTGGGKVE